MVFFDCLVVVISYATVAVGQTSFRIEADGGQSSSFSVHWAPGEIERGRVSLILSRDLTSEPRFSVSSTFSNAAQIFSLEVNATGGSASFPSTKQHGFPFNSLDDFPSGTTNIQAVLTPYEQYNRSDGHVLWLPSFNSFEYSEDYDSYGWANVTTAFGGAKGLSAPNALYSKPVQLEWPLKEALDITLNQKVPDFPAPPPDTKYSKFVSVTSPRLSAFWGRDVNISAWVTLPGRVGV
jgi:hypothetical protein